MKLVISKKVLKITILSILSLSIIGGITIFKIDFQYKPNIIQNQTNIQNQTTLIYQGCPNCPPEFKPLFLYMTFGDKIDQDVEVIIPDGQHAVIHSSSTKQPQTIGYCECNGTKISKCNLFLQYITKSNIESNYTIVDYSNKTECIQESIPGY